ncbi:transcription/translation regulatory transformer protein RfaH [Pseudomonas citronellolis]|uniref:Transcription/translation regulatory transformer protein RfaH n=1 Tax=Pseudomonas citronellolis TaxID=53408 RepID=A0AAW6PH48_9PSED|nr:transcription/translation regulatory transformer protein RfaH [Pseudomonas citronellolis]MDF3846035.1 transcription/translation regulatory transformer protein RfaH [Pseudomonas citronellolis]
MPDATEKRWYLVQCKPRQAFRALENLERQGYECLLPTHQIEQLQKGKLQLLSEPLFPGYLFIQLDKLEDNWFPIRSTRGVNRIVSFGNWPTAVPESIISELRRRDENPKPNSIQVGTRMTLKTTEFRKIEAIFLERHADNRIVILMSLLQRDLKVQIPISHIEKTVT